MKIMTLSAWLALLALLVTGEHLYANQEQTSFKYKQQEINQLKSIPVSSNRLTNRELTELNKQANYVLNQDETLSDAKRIMYKTYLVNAQKDFFLLSQEVSDKNKGSFAPVTLWTIKLFIPNAKLPSIDQQKFDPYSSSIAALVVKEAAMRLKDEKINLKPYPIKKGEAYWHPEQEYFGLEFGNMKPWYLESKEIVRCPALSDTKSYWTRQCDRIKKIMSRVNDRNREAIFYWANMTGINAGDWEYIAEKYMEDNKVPLEKRVQVRSVLLSGMTDSTISAFDSKYTHFIKRPAQTDEEITYVIPVPGHPSYPSGHSTIGKTASVIMTEFFPENSQTWKDYAYEAGMSRIWAGIHYPVDHNEGVIAGEKVAREAIQKSGYFSNIN